MLPPLKFNYTFVHFVLCGASPRLMIDIPSDERIYSMRKVCPYGCLNESTRVPALGPYFVGLTSQFIQSHKALLGVPQSLVLLELVLRSYGFVAISSQSDCDRRSYS